MMGSAFISCECCEVGSDGNPVHDVMRMDLRTDGIDAVFLSSIREGEETKRALFVSAGTKQYAVVRYLYLGSNSWEGVAEPGFEHQRFLEAIAAAEGADVSSRRGSWLRRDKQGRDKQDFPFYVDVGRAGGTFTGEGVYVWPNGTRYEGKFKRGVPHGQGVKTTPGGMRMEGEWRDGKLGGRCVVSFPDGRRYEGDSYDSMGTKMFPNDGHGVMTYPDGTRYEGAWRNGKADTLSSHEQGVMTMPDGTRYEGGWSAGMPNGRGVMTRPNGTRYEGEWSEGKPRRSGMSELTGIVRYEGQWSGGKPDRR